MHHRIAMIIYPRAVPNAHDLIAPHGYSALLKCSEYCILTLRPTHNRIAITLHLVPALLSPCALPCPLQMSFLYRIAPADVRQKFIDYHIITTYNKYGDLRAADSGTDLTTQEGSAITKLGRVNGTIVLLQDKGTIPKPIIIPNLLALASFVVHIIPVVLVPKDY